MIFFSIGGFGATLRQSDSTIKFDIFFCREKALKAYHEERQKKHDRAEYAREKFRENIRQKYGIGRKSAESMDPSEMTLQVREK